jgi:hypothetical protein
MNFNIAPILQFYESRIHQMWGITAPGTLRALKGNLTETLAELIIREAWRTLGGEPGRLTIGRRFYAIRDTQGNRYRLSQDRQIYIDERFVLSMECKAYAEVAMYKRVLVDSYILREAVGHHLQFCLFQLESQLGGDYSTDPRHPRGSPPVHALNAFFGKAFGPINLEIITLLDGERDIKREIHKQEYYKPLTPERVIYALNYFVRALRPSL